MSSNRTLAKEITSLQHPIVKHLVKLRENRRYREQNGTCLIIGNKLTREIKPLKTLLVEKSVKNYPKAETTYLVDEKILKKITGVQSPEKLAAEAFLPKQESLVGKKFLLALDGVQDPGNLGALFRTALALGVNGIFILEGSVDPFNAKAISAAKGASFHLPFRMGTLEELTTLTKENNLHAYVADIDGTPISQVKFKKPLLLILGSEGKGASKRIKQSAKTLAIPMTKNTESLNVSVAGAILIYLASYE